MAVSNLACPVCAAPVAVQPDTEYLRCPFCQSTLKLGREVHGANRELVASLANEGTLTRAELQRMQAMQALGMLKTRLSSIQGEIRTLERAPSSAIANRQLQEVRAEREALRLEIRQLETELSPHAAGTSAGSAPQRVDMRPLWQRLLALFFVPVGRISRLYFAAGAGAVILLILLLAPLVPDGQSGADSGFPGVLMMALVYAYATLAIKRYHDLGKSGWWFFIAFVPFLVFYQWYELLFLPGTVGSNQYGAWPAQTLGELKANAVGAASGLRNERAS